MNPVRRLTPKHCALHARSAVIAALLAGTLCAAPANSGSAPTYSKDVAPILYKNCASCHRAGEIAPMSLLTYKETRPWAASIREKVTLGEMPPWHSNDPRGTFSNDRRLSVAERDTIVRWVVAGAPEGNPKELPPIPMFAEGWEIGKPDVVLSMSKAYDVPASGTVNYQYFTIPTNFTEDKWVQAIEVRPGERKVVHHILVFVRQQDKQPLPPAFTSIVPAPSAQANGQRQGEARGPGYLLATTAPGTNAMTFQPGTAVRVPAGATLIFQVHYTADGIATKDQSSVGMIFAKQPPQTEIRNSAFVNATFTLPAGSANEQVDSAIRFDEDSHIWALFPHTHLRGKSWSYRLVYPDGHAQDLLSVPKYDFNWQTYYVFSTPVAVPKGARLEATAHYDNSTANKWNPDPTKEVHWGEQTWQEMQYSGITYSVDHPALSASSH